MCFLFDKYEKQSPVNVVSNQNSPMSMLVQQANTEFMLLVCTTFASSACVFNS